MRAPASPEVPPFESITLPLLLSGSLRLTPEQFAELCHANPDAVLELAADGSLICMTPTGGETGARNAELSFQIQAWARATGGWKAFDSSTGFRLPDNSVLSPDASLVAKESSPECSGCRPAIPCLQLDMVPVTGSPEGCRKALPASISADCRVSQPYCMPAPSSPGPCSSDATMPAWTATWICC